MEGKVDTGPVREAAVGVMVVVRVFAAEPGHELHLIEEAEEDVWVDIVVGAVGRLGRSPRGVQRRGTRGG